MGKIRVPLCRPDLGPAEISAIKACFKSGAVSHGPQVKDFERCFADYIGSRHAVSLNSCTSALYLLCAYLRKTKGPGEIIVPSFTFVASVNAVVSGGMTPRMVDVDWETGNIGAAHIEKGIHKNTKGVMVVHYAGRPCDMGPISKLARKFKLFLIEDCAECIGASVSGRPAGSFGHGAFSFYGTKNITTGEGGMITTNDDDMAGWLRLKIAHGVKKGSYSREGVAQKFHRNAVMSGQNFRLSNLQAAMGLIQLEKLRSMNARRYMTAKMFTEACSKINGVDCPELLPEGRHSYQMFPIKVPAEKRDRMVAYLNLKDIEASVHFDPPVHWQTAYRKERHNLPVTEKLSLSTITLPISSVQTEAQTQYVILHLRKAASL